MTSFWSFFIIILFTTCNALLLWILISNQEKEGDEISTTGHVYDGIEEYNNPAPAWFFNLFIATFIFGAIYLVLYPGFGSFKGVLGWTQVGELNRDVQKAEDDFTALVEPYMAQSAAELVSNREALKMGKRLFKNNCSTCHGTDGKGSYAFPNLTDNDWLYGGAEANIKQTITHGRHGVMPAWGAALGNDLAAMADYTIKLGNEDVSQHPMNDKYAMLCSACHQKDGSGSQILGAPNLRDDIWLYGGSSGEVMLTINKGRAGKMPSFKDTLSEQRIHLVTAYVLSLAAKQQQ